MVLYFLVCGFVTRYVLLWKFCQQELLLHASHHYSLCKNIFKDVKAS